MPYINQDGVLVDSAPPLQPPAGAMAPNPMPTPGPVQSMGQPLSSGLSPASNISIPPAGPPRVPQDPDTRAALWRNLMGDFIWSLASGASAGANALPGQRNRAAFAGALMGPYNRQANATAVRDREAQAELRISEAKNLSDKLEEQKRHNTELFGVQKETADALAKLHESEAKRHDAETEAAGFETIDFPGAAGQPGFSVKVQRGKTADFFAKIRGQNVTQEGPRYLKTEDGAFYDTQTKALVPGTESSTEVPITKELAENSNNPKALEPFIGRMISLKELTKIMPPKTVVAKTREGVVLADAATGNVIKKIGDLPPTTDATAVGYEDDPTNPGHVRAVVINKANATSQPVTTPTGGSLSKETPQAASAGSKLEREATDARTQFNVLTELVKAANNSKDPSVYDQDLILKHFDIAMPAIGRRFNQTEVNRLASVGTLSERAEIALQMLRSRGLFTPELRNEILNSARINVEGKEQSWKDYQRTHAPKAPATAIPAFKVDANRKVSPR